MSKTSSPTGDGWVGFLKAPTAKSGRANFSIVRRKSVDGKYIHETVQSEALSVINTQFKSKFISFDRARFLAKDLVDQINQKKAVQFNQANLELVDNYFEQEYSYRDIVDKRSAKNRLYRSVEAIGSYSLLSATREELQREIDSKLKGNKQRTVVAALNQLLKFFKSPVKLRQGRPEVRKVPYVTETEFKKLITFIKDPDIRLMHEVAFGTGLRAGELFGVTADSIFPKHVRVDSQIDIERVRRQTKNRKARNAYILKEYKNALISWANLSLETRLTFRKRSISKITRKASREALGREITFHDLRHSYAIHLISRGHSLTLVSLFIGDSIAVTERYYSGFEATPESIEYLDL